ncbi:hypothetical protein [Streptomyces sp. NPDC007264]|uniref:hypothetical protein n=1 Tax=Streptomyces sp. NPDC007264 TaxID=3364777 RepID=UPI0036DF8CA0
MHGSGADGGHDKGTAASRWAGAVANLLIGAVAIVPGVCARWLLSRYVLAGCAKGSPDNTVGMALGAVLGGAFVLGMALVVNVLVPWQEGRPLGQYLRLTPLIPAPFAIAQAAGWI